MQLKQQPRLPRSIVWGLIGVITSSSVWVAADRAMAQSNQSDTSGPGVVDPVGPQIIVPEPGDGLEPLDPTIINPDTLTLDESTLQAARDLARELDDAYADCEQSKAAAEELPRRFARGPSSTAETCISAECVRLNELTQQTRAFLDGLDRAQRELLQRSQIIQLW